jgi:hypothetical protein
MVIFVYPTRKRGLRILSNKEYETKSRDLPEDKDQQEGALIRAVLPGRRSWSRYHALTHSASTANQFRMGSGSVAYVLSYNQGARFLPRAIIQFDIDTQQRKINRVKLVTETPLSYA